MHLHRRARVLSATLVLTVPALGGCGIFGTMGLAPEPRDPTEVREVPARPAEPDRVTVRHVLISFDEARTKGSTRTRAEAKALAAKVQSLAKSGRDFGELVRLYSDDRHADGVYRLVNYGVAPAQDEEPRSGMVRAFGDAAFSLAVGGIALVEYDSKAAPFGWHVIRRDR